MYLYNYRDSKKQAKINRLVSSYGLLLHTAAGHFFLSEIHFSSGKPHAFNESILVAAYQHTHIKRHAFDSPIGKVKL